MKLRDIPLQGLPCTNTASKPTRKEKQMQINHTPGPWACGDGGPEYGKGYAICAGHQIVARVNGFGYPLCKGNAPESDANARLIAAAPELLAALKGLIEVDLYHENYHITARAAICKAEGREP